METGGLRVADPCVMSSRNETFERSLFQRSRNGSSIFGVFAMSTKSLIAVWILALSVFSLGNGNVKAAPFSREDLSVLKRAIMEFSLQEYRRIYSDGSYRGEAGVLMLRPEVARFYGLQVPENENYGIAKELFSKAEDCLRKTVEALASENEGTSEEEILLSAGKWALCYNRSRGLAGERMEAYRRQIDRTVDQRTNDAVCLHLMETLLRESLQKAPNSLREGLARFYNACHGIENGRAPLKPENVRFVNCVFEEFTRDRSSGSAGAYGEPAELHPGRSRPDERPNAVWKKMMGEKHGGLTGYLERAFEEGKGADHWVDPLLFLALIKQESGFDPKNVSSVGAAGLTQIMPQTAMGLGMKNIFLPPYFKEAQEYLKQERKLRRKALDLVSQINTENMMVLTGQARALMQESMACRKNRRELFARYEKDLLQKGDDERLDPGMAILHGFRYFSQMMSRQKGDISLALASYNAGPHRVTQYRGIPPFAETVTFRNRVLSYYKDYLRQCREILTELEREREASMGTKEEEMGGRQG